MTITIPEGWHDVTVNQFQALREIDRKDYPTDLAYTEVILQILCDIPSGQDFSLDIISKIMPYLSFLSSEPSKKKLKKFRYNNTNYEWIGDFSQITLGEAISIEQIIDIEDLTYDQTYDVILAVLLRKEGEPFSSNSFVKNRDEFGRLPITLVIGQLFFFLNGGRLYTRNTWDYSIITRTTKKTIQKKNGKLSKLLMKTERGMMLINGFRWLTSYLKAILQTMKKLIK